MRVPHRSISRPAMQEPDRVGELEREDDVAVVDFRPAELLLQRRLEDRDDLTIDVVDRRREKQQRADDPARVAGPPRDANGLGWGVHARLPPRIRSLDCAGESRTRGAAALRPRRACRTTTASTSANSRSAASSSVSVSPMTPLTSRSMLSAICFAVRALPVILMTGATGLPVGVPRPVVKTTTCAPPPTMPVTDSTSSPGVSMTVRPDFVMRPAYGTTSTTARSFAALVGRAERLLLDRRQPAADVAGRRLRAANVETERDALRLRRDRSPAGARGRLPAATRARRARARRP